MSVLCGILLTLICFGSVKCGTKVVEGVDTDIEQRPYLASVEITKVNIRYFFSGCIIDQWYILTSGSCTSRIGSASEVEVSVGGNNREDGTTYFASSWMTHPRYNDSPNNNDAGLIRLATPIVINVKVQIIPLPPKDWELDTFSEFIACAYGEHKDGRLQCVTLCVQPYALCTVFHTDIKTTMFCGNNLIFDAQGGSPGDAGGPAVQYINGIPCVIGLFALGRGCDGDAISNLPVLTPTVFTKIYIPCIRDFIEEYSGVGSEATT